MAKKERPPKPPRERLVVRIDASEEIARTKAKAMAGEISTNKDEAERLLLQAMGIEKK